MYSTQPRIGDREHNPLQIIISVGGKYGVLIFFFTRTSAMDGSTQSDVIVTLAIQNYYICDHVTRVDRV